MKTPHSTPGAPPARLIAHEAITASAGSGKTFQLASRYVKLLALGVSSDRICALTFSRKAAGEIFDSVVEHLCKAAATDAGARAAGKRLGLPSVTPATFRRQLRLFLSNLHRNHIGTLDSFMIGILRTFPSELGVSADFEVMDGEGAAGRELRREVLERIFRSPAVDAAAQQDFLAAFKQATFGHEEKTMSRSLDRFVGEFRARFQAARQEDVWGSPDAIWPAGCPWLADRATDLAAAAAGLRSALETAATESAVMARWNDFLAAMQVHTAGRPLPLREGAFLEKLLEARNDLREGTASIVVERKARALSPPVCAAAYALARAYLAGELAAALEQSRGIYRVLEKYDAVYQSVSRRAGRLTFDDAQYLLAPANEAGAGLAVSRLAGVEGRLYIDFRLDSQLDHWLLDEFQDTSDLQWSVLRNLADEILQDGSGLRSFFYVGDVKQAIYAWRGGNARLSGEILSRYGPAIEQRPLSESFRSCPPVIDCVNAVFGDFALPGLPESAVRMWREQWDPHSSSHGHVPATGYAAVLEPPCDNGATKPTREDIHRLTAGVIRDLQPHERGLGVAVLVRSNKAGRMIVDALRRELPGLTIVHEGHASIMDDPGVALLLAVLRYATHPGDELAWRHILMSPLGAALSAAPHARDALLQGVLEQVQRHGVRPFVETWARRLRDSTPLDDFGSRRLHDLEAAASEFDAAGEPDVDAFLRFMEHYTIHEEAFGHAIRVMTIHQSKGLGFDVVLLPDLMDGGFGSGGDAGVLVHRRSATGRPDWVLRMPRRSVAAQDEVLAEAVGQYDSDACFEELCLLYVALTRAKRGLYVITAFPGKTSQSISAAAVIKTRLCGDPKPVGGPEARFGGESCVCLYETGARGWHATVVPPVTAPPETPRALPPRFAERPSVRRTVGHILPSTSEEQVVSAARLFTLETREILDFGSTIHRLFEQIEWIEDADPEAILSACLPDVPADDAVKRDVANQFRAAVAAAPIRELLRRPDVPCVLWRELRFDIILDGNLISGVFDRVLVLRDCQDRPAHAVIVDYKSNRVDSEAQIDHSAEGYAPQLNLYRRALGRILGLPEARIDARLAFTRPGVVREVSPEQVAPADHKKRARK